MYHPFLWKERSKEWLILFIQCLEGKLKVLEFELYGWMQNDQLNCFSETQSTYTVSLVIKKNFLSLCNCIWVPFISEITEKLIYTLFGWCVDS